MQNHSSFQISRVVRLTRLMQSNTGYYWGILSLCALLFMSIIGYRTQLVTSTLLLQGMLITAIVQINLFYSKKRILALTLPVRFSERVAAIFLSLIVSSIAFVVLFYVLVLVANVVNPVTSPLPDANTILFSTGLYMVNIFRSYALMLQNDNSYYEIFRFAYVIIALFWASFSSKTLISRILNLCFLLPLFFLKRIWSFIYGGIVGLFSDNDFLIIPIPTHAVLIVVVILLLTFLCFGFYRLRNVQNR